VIKELFDGPQMKSNQRVLQEASLSKLNDSFQWIELENFERVDGIGTSSVERDSTTSSTASVC
jgi:hypothetical protein